MKPVSEKLLCPKLLTEKDSSYESVKELNTAVTLGACKNIAVTGIYGAGKSSVINTFISEYEKNNKDKRILRISLSTFDLNEDRNRGNNIDKKYENDIEYKLVQQILYRSNPEELYQSSFNRIHYRPSENIRCLAGRIITSLVALIILFEPSFLRVKSFYDLYFKVFGTVVGGWINIIFDLICLGYLIYIGYLLIIWAIKRISAISSLKFKAKDVEFEVSKDSSVFSKLLEELNYYFRAGKYDVVIIEDLDRLNNPAGLFLKLRELNIMLNESYAFRSEKKVLKFIYAVKDDLFDSDVRVKFFDYIVPVVPVIDAHNAADYIIEQRKDIYEGKDEFKQNIPEIALYIKEMRVLKNILNEFEIYQKTILVNRSHLSDSKLFAMLVYKNLWPDNYSNLHKRTSILNKLFDNPKEVVEKLYSQDVDKQALLKIEIDKLEEEAKAIRKEFMNYLENEYDVEKFVSDSLSYTLNELIENDYLFLRFQQDKFDKYIFIDRVNRESGTNERDFTFDEIDEKIDHDGAMAYRMGQLREELQRFQMEKAELERKLAHKKASTYREILANVKGDLALDCIKEHVGTDVPKELVEFILSMLRRGYIAEDYHSYISFYYEGTISTKDSGFINAVLQGRTLDYDYKLDNPKEVRKQLSKEDLYNSNSILNYSYIAYLMKVKDGYLENVTKAVRRNWDFIRECDIVGNEMSKYLRNHVFYYWYDCLTNLFKENKTYLTDNIRVFFHYCPEQVFLNNEARVSLSTMYEVIASATTADSASLVASWIKSNVIVFKNVRAPLTEYERPLYDTVLDEGLFEINTTNLLVIFGKAFEEASYTTIRKCNNVFLVSYLEEHLVVAIKAFPNGSVKEEGDYLKNLLNNDKIDRAWKETYLSKQNTILDNLKDLSEETTAMIVKSGKLKATWANINVAISKGVTEFLKTFIAENVTDLATQKCELEEDDVDRIEKTLFANNDYLSLEHYDALTSSFSTPLDPEILSGLSNERMTILVKRSLIGFSEPGLAILSSYKTPVVAQYVIDHFEEYKNYTDNSKDLCDNEFGALILGSQLSDEQKSFYLDKVAPSDLESDKHYYTFSKLICEFFNRVGITDNTDIDLAVNALTGYNDQNGCEVKISLINKINVTKGYDKERVTRMINALGVGYLKLNSYYGSTSLDNTVQNTQLLKFLTENNHYVNRFYPQGDGRLKVTFKRKR